MIVLYFLLSLCYDDCVCIQMNFAINVHISIGGHAYEVPVIQEIYIVHVENNRFYVCLIA